ncbi:MAG TPA: aspartyl protease family protein, partial [Phenylobacterium sp.]
MKAIWAGVVAALMLAGSAQAQAPGCKLRKLGDLPVTMVGLKPHVPVRVNGQDVMFVADSGAWFSMIDEASAKRLGLSTGITPPGLRVRGVAGSAAVKVGVAKTFGIAGAEVNKVDFLVGGPVLPGAPAGILGQNVLGAFDVEYDFANGVMRLFKPEGCAKANLAYWAAGKPVTVLAFQHTTPVEPHAISQAFVNGKPIKVMFDTGAFRSVLKRSTAEKLGFRQDGPGVEYGGVSFGIGPRQIESWIAPFEAFAIGDEQIKNTRLRVAAIALQPADMLLGADFFLSHRVMVSNSQDRLFFTYNGGPVFRLEPVRSADAPLAPQPASSTT